MRRDACAALTIEGNGATLDHDASGFFHVDGGALTLHKLTIQGSDGSNAALEIEGDLILRDVTMKENVNSSTGGGAIYASYSGGSATVDIDGGIFLNNTTAFDGGAIQLRGGLSSADFRIANSQFIGNGNWIGAPLTVPAAGGAIDFDFNTALQSMEIRKVSSFASA